MSATPHSARTPPPGQRCQILIYRAEPCPTCGQVSAGGLVRCTSPAAYKRLDWWCCAAHRESGVLDSRMIGVK